LPGLYIQNGPSELKANYWSVPIAYDWNSDGKKDLLVGQRYIDENNTSYGYISLYENIGTDSAPLFNGATFLQVCNTKCSHLNVAAIG